MLGRTLVLLHLVRVSVTGRVRVRVRVTVRVTIRARVTVRVRVALLHLLR